MGSVLLVRAVDNLVLGVRWTGFTVSGTGTSARLTAGAQASVLLTMPPQHIAEEASATGSPAPEQKTTASGVKVPVWRAVLSGGTRIKVGIASGQQVPLTIEGVLAAVADRPLLMPTAAPGTEDTAIELPYRLLIAPAVRGHPPGATVVCRHPSHVDSDSQALWRTRLVDATADRTATLTDANLELTVADRATADLPDPQFPLPNLPPNVLALTHDDRLTVFNETTGNHRPARLNRLELSTLGGTLDVAGIFPAFEWQHHTVLGRDMRVRKQFRGALYPLGHPAVFVEFAERVFDPDAVAGGAAVLRIQRVLTVLDPVRHAPADGPVRRAFPLGDVEITRNQFDRLTTPEWKSFTFPGSTSSPTYFMPKVTNLQDPEHPTPLMFPVSCTSVVGGVRRIVNLDMPLIFVRDQAGSLTNIDLAHDLDQTYSSAQVRIAPTDVDLIGSDVHGGAGPADVFEVHALRIAGYGRNGDLSDGYRAQLTALEVALPALRTLLDTDVRTTVTFAENYVKNGLSEHVVLEMAANLAVDFTKHADRAGGLVAPAYVTDAISRTYGPVSVGSLLDSSGLTDPKKLFPDDTAKLLGFPLRALVRELKNPPKLTSLPGLDRGAPPQVQMEWNNVELDTQAPFLATREGHQSTMSLSVKTGTASSETTCTINNFTLQFPPGDAAVLELSFASMTFLQRGVAAPTLNVAGVGAKFVGHLALVERLSKAVQLGDAGKLIDVASDGISVRYRLPAPPVTSGVFVMRNIAFNSVITIPFDNRPVSISLGFSSRANPFQLAVMMFGGTGYMELELVGDRIERIEAALEFGAFIAVDFVVAAGEVHALGGVRFVAEGGEITVAGYLRIGGSVQVLGLITVSVELCLTLEYRSKDNALVGRATLVIEVDLTLWSDSVELDSGEWRFPGTGDKSLEHTMSTSASAFTLWQDYRAAFADATPAADH